MSGIDDHTTPEVAHLQPGSQENNLPDNIIQTNIRLEQLLLQKEMENQEQQVLDQANFSQQNLQPDTADMRQVSKNGTRQPNSTSVSAVTHNPTYNQHDKAQLQKLEAITEQLNQNAEELRKNLLELNRPQSSQRQMPATQQIAAIQQHSNQGMNLADEI